jgi:hypothetical protein
LRWRQVLHDGGEAELIAGTGEATQPKSFEAKVDLKCAKRISTRFRSSRDLAKALVPIFRRATSRASSSPRSGLNRDEFPVLNQRGQYLRQQVKNVGRHGAVVPSGLKLGDVSALIGDSTGEIFNTPINLGQTTCLVHRRPSYLPTRSSARDARGV